MPQNCIVWVGRLWNGLVNCAYVTVQGCLFVFGLERCFGCCFSSIEVHYHRNTCQRNSCQKPGFRWFAGVYSTHRILLPSCQNTGLCWSHRASVAKLCIKLDVVSVKCPRIFWSLNVTLQITRNTPFFKGCLEINIASFECQTCCRSV